ncbi:sensor histidine kinase [Mucilaginibacter sp.]|uniref:sensor histidine kinase n=1 Tax=Mucilaginibacter sp. TaxID=1882438 RepID=UPI002ED20D8E
MKIFVQRKPTLFTVIVLLSGVLFSKTIAQTIESSQPLYRNFTNINSGLSSNIVYKMVTDGYGYIWLATERGLVRYDGDTFRKYTAPETDNEFIQVYKPNDSLLWLFGYSGNSRLFNLKTHTFTAVLDEPNTPSFKSPVILAWQKKDTLSLYRINSTFSQTVLSSPKRQWPIGKTAFINSLLTRWKIPDHVNGIATDTLSALFNYKPYAIQIIGDALILGNKIFRQKGNMPATLIFDGDSEKIIGNISSFVRIGNDLYLGFVESQELLLIQNFFSLKNNVPRSYSKILTQVPVTSLVSDYQGNLWVGTLGKGVYLFTPADLATRHLQETLPDDNGLDNYISGISELDNGVVVLGHDRDRISILFKGKVVKLKISNRQSINEIRAVYKAANNWFFFGNQNSYVGKGMLMPGKISPLAISSHTPFKDGVAYHNRYYFTTKSACFIINTDGSISTDPKYKGINTLSVAPFNETVCFYGTSDGIYRNDVKERLFSSIRINKLRVLTNNLIVCTQEGAFAVQLNDKGELGSSTKILKQNCYDIKADDQYCYLKTGSGLVIFRINDWKLINEIDAARYSFSINDFSLETDTLALATNNGVYYMPKRFVCGLKSTVSPKIYLACSLTGFDVSKATSETIYSRKLSITLLADVLDYTNETRNISYQINYNGDAVSNWQTINDRTITLNNQKPGKYLITIKAKGEYSELQSSTSYTIIIRPLWYQRIWVTILFGCLVTVGVGFFVFGWYKVQLQKAEKKMNDHLRMNELENKNLFAQLKPHFIFNVLTPLQSYFINGDDIGGLKYLDNYAKLMRGFLQESRESYITIEKEIDFLKHYLFIQQQRFSNGFSYSFVVDTRLVISQLYIPTLILQPIVENAVEHGVKNENGLNANMRIRFEPDDNKLLVSVMDNGKGFKNGEPFLKPNHALEIIKERLELIRLKHQVGMLHITSNGNQPGTTVTIELPLLTTQP